MISLSFESLKSVKAAAMKNEKGSMKNNTSGSMNIYILVISHTVRWITAVYVANLIIYIKDAIEKSGKNTVKKITNSWLRIYFCSIFIR
jgi:hypothetical protein